MISRGPIPAHQKYVIFEMMCDDQTHKDVEVPYIRLRLE